MRNLIRKLVFNYFTQSILLFISGILVALLLLTYKMSDPSWNTQVDNEPLNYLWYFGSYTSDILFQIFGLSVFMIPSCVICWSIMTYKGKYRVSMTLRSFGLFIAMILCCCGFGKWPMNFLPAGAGGILGILLSPYLQQQYLRWILFIFAMIVFFISSGINAVLYRNFVWFFKTQLSYILQFFFSSNKNLYSNTNIKKPFVTLKSRENQNLTSSTSSLASSAKVEHKQLTIPKLINQNSNSLPAVDLLNKKSGKNIAQETDSELREKAENLLNVLNDFGVKGQIVGISQGPVVTLYEFEPAAGTKSSRVIGLSDDIARSLSAVSARIATIAGRNALGIELPNKHRAFFCLQELIETEEYQDPSVILPLILGKDLAGKAYVADLAKMPHLLVAGTTGSGKSVAINTMIMSLLYRYTSDQCKLIMIDPKMLELSAYDGIPHLLTPVVTEANKAITALKWAVKEMENRYRLMSTLGVRNIAGYNAKIAQSVMSGKILDRTVQTGFNPETGKPIYESVPLNMEKLPFIVVIVDEMADLMLVAGKDIESSIQRLAQMARAAGIHIIMATQRPSVDVITGVIKANFPSRVSFKVTSKIDSRTILGEQGAEQLLGMGDMLYMGNTSKINRVHGPFVDDNEVEKVTSYLRSIGTPDYIYSVTESEDSENYGDANYSKDGEDGNDLYNQAIQIVKLERKISISYIQRCLRIGYNRAADIVERMEKDGIVSPPSSTGRREILIPE